jgi:hypothetical protein
MVNDPAVVAEFSSQWLTQGDLMAAWAPRLYARSDTFRIRTYGDTVNPATGATVARAWSEAIVQRLPEYRDGSQEPATAPAGLTPANRALGRRFVVISFRWLDHSDI